MKKTISNQIILLGSLFSLLFLFAQCGDDDPDPMVSDDFTLEKTWNFESVQASASIASGMDEDPEGCITFMEDGTGISFFKFHIPPFNPVDFPSDTIQWESKNDATPPDTIIVTQSDGQIFEWVFSNGSADTCVAKFDFPISGFVVETKVSLSKK